MTKPTDPQDSTRTAPDSAAPGGGHAGSGWGLFDNSPDDSGADQQADQDFGGFDDSGDNSDFGGSDAA